MTCSHLLCPKTHCVKLSEPPKKKKARGQPRSPWRVRVEQERAAESVMAQVERAILAGHADKVLAQLTGLLAVSSFSTFCQAAWHVVEPSTTLDWGKHHELICTTLQALLEDWLKTKSDSNYIPHVLNTVFNTPPGSLKSRIVSVFYHAYSWLRCPGMKFIYLSVNESAAMRDARATRDLIRSDWYQETFKPSWAIKGDQDAISDFGNNAGGGRLSQASGSEIVGLRSDCVAGDTLVATEVGDVPISVLHQTLQSGGVIPRVWSLNQESSVIELKHIRASKVSTSSQIVDVRTESNDLLRCTDAHRVYTQGNYTQAAHLGGCQVSILQRSHLSIETGHSSEVPRLSVRDSDMCALQHGISEARSGIRQEGEERAGGWSVLQQELQNDDDAGTRGDAGLCSLQEGVQDQGQEGQGSLLEEMLSGVWNADLGREVRTQGVSGLSGEVQSHLSSTSALFQGVRQQSAFPGYDRKGELELLGSSWQNLRRKPVGQLVGDDQTQGRLPVHSVRRGRVEQSAAGASCGRQSAAQRPRELDNTVRFLSHHPPQAKNQTVLSVKEAFEGGRRAEIEVYDIEVEGNHNFFANNILVHNCLIVDDANNPNDSNNIGERKKVNDLWDTNQYNRVNDPNKSMRITIQQRTHAGDHTGHIIAKQGLWSLNNRTGWLHVVLPAEFEVKRPAFKLPAPLRRLVKDLPGIVMDDWRRKQGEVLHPKRMTAEYLEAEKRRWAGTGNYAGQMQQRPSSEGGGKVKKLHYGWFRLARGVRDDIDGEDNGFPRPEGCHLGEAVVIGSATHRPGKWDFDQIVISVDPALKKTEAGSLWGMLAIGYKGAGRYVLDDRSERGEPDEAVAILKEMILYWDPDKLLIEDKAGGPGMTRTLKVEMAEGKLPMVLIEEVNPGTQDKDVRLNTAIPTIANGNLYLRDGCRWTHDVVEEVSGYPGAMTNDRLDCITQAINHANETNFVLPAEGSWAAAGL